MLVYEIRLKVMLKKDLVYYEAGEIMGRLLNKVLCDEPEYLKLHEESRDYKFYVYDTFIPCEKDRIYKAGKVYRIRIRTVKENLAEFFFENLPEKETADIKCIRADIGVVPKKNLEKVYSLTPAVMKNYPEGYWRDIMSAAQFEKRLLDNLVKKYKYLTGEAIDENIMMYNGIRFMNSRPIKVSYKGITLLGDKIELTVAQNRTAQKLMYMALGAGILENNANGCGFVNFS